MTVLLECYCICYSCSYLAATEDGLIHKCSCSYNEQYLDTYEGHTVSYLCIEYTLNSMQSYFFGLSALITVGSLNSSQ